jgi:hypothetical protein
MALSGRLFVQFVCFSAFLLDKTAFKLCEKFTFGCTFPNKLYVIGLSLSLSERVKICTREWTAVLEKKSPKMLSNPHSVKFNALLLCEQWAKTCFSYAIFQNIHKV